MQTHPAKDLQYRNSQQGFEQSYYRLCEKVFYCNQPFIISFVVQGCLENFFRRSFETFMKIQVCRYKLLSWGNFGVLVAAVTQQPLLFRGQRLIWWEWSETSRTMGGFLSTRNHRKPLAGYGKRTRISHWKAVNFIRAKQAIGPICLLLGYDHFPVGVTDRDLTLLGA